MVDTILLLEFAYHLLDKSDRIKAMNAAKKSAKSGVAIFVAFISMTGGIIYSMKCFLGNVNGRFQTYAI